MKIAVAGAGYVGLSIAMLLAQKNQVTVIDIDEFFHSKVINDLDEFKQSSDLIIANRFSVDLEDVKDKLYTRDLFNVD